MEEKTKAVIKAQKRKKLHAVIMFGGKCQICGYDRCINALEFHHLDKNTKDEKPSYIILRRSWEKVKKELDKCILVCANCHREIHAEENPLNLDLRIYSKPWIKKECKFCHSDFETKNDKQIYCSLKCHQFSSRKTMRPTKEELITLINENSWVSIGKMFGVSDNAVRKWAKNYKIPL